MCSAFVQNVGLGGAVSRSLVRIFFPGFGFAVPICFLVPGCGVGSCFGVLCRFFNPPNEKLAKELESRLSAICVCHRSAHSNLMPSVQETSL